ncbi:P-type conjugative transfer protein TrbL [Afipia sp. 1NLS2]|nr:P-type conjugative transfer protein TrbL [Afipia sp. 1NLS2]
MNNVGVIDTFLNTFTTYIDSGFGLIKGEVGYLSSTLIVIDITLAGLFWAWGADEDILQRLVKKTLYIGFFAFIINNFNNLSAIVFNSFAGLGLKAGGSSISTADFLRPGKLAQVGLDAGQPLLDAANQMMGFTSFFANFVQIAVLMVSWVLVLIAFFILAVQLFVTLIEFKLTTLAGFILIPFALFNKTAFLAEKVLGNIVASGVKVMVLAVIVGIGTGLFSQFTQTYAGGQPTVEQALSVVLAALAMLGLGIFGPGIATGLVSGAPQLGAGAAVGTGLAVAGTAMAGAGALGVAGRGRWPPLPVRPPPHAAARRWPVAHPPPTAWLRPDDPARRASRRVLAGWDARRLQLHQARCGALPPRPLAPCAKASQPARVPASPPRAARRPRERSAAIRRAGQRRPGVGQPTSARRPGHNA